MNSARVEKQLLNPRKDRKLRSEKFQRRPKELSFPSHPVLTAAGKIIFTSIASVCVSSQLSRVASLLQTHCCELLKDYILQYFSTTSVTIFSHDFEVLHGVSFVKKKTIS